MRFAIAAFVAFTAACAAPTDDVDDDVGSTDSAIATQDEADAFWKKYEKSDSDIEKEWRSNNHGKPWGGDYLAWHEAPREEALVDMYVATKDTKFIREAMKRMDVVLSLRDDRIDRKDDVRGKVMPAWGRFADVGRETRSDTWVAEMVQNGLITYPIAELVRVIEAKPALKAEFGEKAARYRDRVAETVDAFDADWDDNGRQGFYRFPKGYGKVYAPHEGRYLPYNRALLLGKTMIALEETNIGGHKKDKYRERVRNMARFFLDDATKIDGGTRLAWQFATWAPEVEDTSHGGLDVSFFAIAGKHDYSSVGNADISRFVETFKKISSNEKQMASRVNGDTSGGSDDKDANETCGRYLDLAAHEPSLANRCKTVIDKGFDEKQRGYAKMLRYRRR